MIKYILVDSLNLHKPHEDNAKDIINRQEFER